MQKSTLKRLLKKATHCTIQHDGWPCGTCFFSLSSELNNQDWQSLLLFRGDYKREELNNLPEHPEKSIEKIYNLIKDRQ